MSKKEKFDFTAGNLLAYILRRFKVLALISLGAGIITAFATLFIDNLYKSSIVLFPTAQVSVSKSLVDGNYSKGKGELFSVGEEEELDQLQQMLNSSDLLLRLIERFDLMEHYKIDTTSKKKHKLTLDILSSSMKISRTEFGSVSVQIWDKDPQFAAKLANAIPILLDSLYFNMEQDRKEKAYNLIKFELDSLTKNISVLKDSLHKYLKLGLIDITPQTNQITKAYYKALLKGRTDVAAKAKKDLGLIQEYGANFILLRDEIVYNQRQQAFLMGKLQVAQVALKENLTRRFTVNKAFASEHKDSPKRSLIVLVAMIITFFTALMAFIIAENIKKLK